MDWHLIVGLVLLVGLPVAAVLWCLACYFRNPHRHPVVLASNRNMGNEAPLHFWFKVWSGGRLRTIRLTPKQFKEALRAAEENKQDAPWP
jgi:hypothetical protein